MPLSGAQAQSILLAVLLATAAIPPASVGADATPATGDETTFHVTQGSDCYEITAHGNGTTSVEDFYDYRRPSNTDPPVYTYSSHGTRDLQANQVSNLFVYNGTEGYSLVMLHDKLDDGPYGSTVTFEISGLPADREWVVEDDAYEGRDDNYDHGATNSTIDWMWAPDRTDGAAVRGLGGDDYEAVTIDPAFNEDASAWGDWSYSGGDHRIRDWRLLDADGSAVSLAMDHPASVAEGGCDDDGATTTTTETTTTTTETTTAETSTTTTTETTTETTTTTENETTTETTTAETTTQTTRETTTKDETTATTSTTTITSTTEATTTTTETTTTTTSDESSGEDDSSSNDGDDSSKQAVKDENSDSSQSGGVQGVAGSQSANEDDPGPSRVTENLSDADGRFGNVTLETNASDANLVVETDGPPPDDVRAPTPQRDGFATLSYVRTEADRTTGTDVAAMTATVTLSTDRLEALEASPGDVSLFRFENGSWTGVPTEQVDRANETVGFRANVTNATYAVGVGQPVIDVTNLTLDASEVTVDQSMSAVVTVENEGRANGTRTVRFAIDGEVVATRNVSVPAGATREVAFTRQFDVAGPREVAVGDERASVVVEAMETTATADPATTDATISTTPATSDPGASVPGFGVAAALVALAGAVLFIVRRG